MDNQIKQLEERIRKLEQNQIGVIMLNSSDLNILRSLQRTLSTNPLSVGSTNPTKSALLELVSTTKGLIFSRMTTAQRDAIVNPINGLVIYNLTTNKLNVYTTVWEAITSA